METVTVQNVTFHNYSFNQFADLLMKRVNGNKKTFVVTANPELVMYANRDRDYLHVLRQADFVTPDGIGVVIASKILRKPLKERVAGYDLMNELLRRAERENRSVYLLGAKGTTLEKAYRNIKKQYPDLKIVGRHHGYFDIEDETVADEIARLQPDFVFAALGFPKQEFWISRYIGKFEKGLFMGVGGSFDVWAGEVKRAPDVWIKLHLEWLYRLIKQPSRWKRMLVLPQFLVKVLAERK